MRKFLSTLLVLLMLTGPAAGQMVTPRDDVRNVIQTAAGGSGGGVGGTAILYSGAYDTGGTAVQYNAGLTTTPAFAAIPFTSESDVGGVFDETTTAGEVCYTGSSTANVVVEVEVAAVSSIDTPAKELWIGKGTTGALTTIGSPSYVQISNYDGVSSVTTVTSMAPNDCFGVFVGRVSGASSPTWSLYGAHITIFASGADDSPMQVGGGVVEAKDATADLRVGRGEAQSGSDAFYYDVSTGKLTLRDVDGSGGGFVTEPPDATGEPLELSESGNNGAAQSVTIKAADSLTSNHTLELSDSGVTYDGSAIAGGEEYIVLYLGDGSTPNTYTLTTAGQTAFYPLADFNAADRGSDIDNVSWASYSSMQGCEGGGQNGYSCEPDGGVLCNAGGGICVDYGGVAITETGDYLFEYHYKVSPTVTDSNPLTLLDCITGIWYDWVNDENAGGAASPLVRASSGGYNTNHLNGVMSKAITINRTNGVYNIYADSCVAPYTPNEKVDWDVDTGGSFFKIIKLN